MNVVNLYIWVSKLLCWFCVLEPSMAKQQWSFCLGVNVIVLVLCSSPFGLYAQGSSLEAALSSFLTEILKDLIYILWCDI